MSSVSSLTRIESPEHTSLSASSSEISLLELRRDFRGQVADRVLTRGSLERGPATAGRMVGGSLSYALTAEAKDLHLPHLSGVGL